MGKPVTVDSDDLEVLLNASVAGREIEKIIKAVRADPAQIRLEAKGEIEQSMSRVSRARADAIRHPGDRSPDYGKPPEGQAENSHMAWLFFETCNEPGIVVDVRSWDGLRAKGLVVMGNATEHIKWGDGDQQAIPHARLRVKLTTIGRQWCERELAKP